MESRSFAIAKYHPIKLQSNSRRNPKIICNILIIFDSFNIGCGHLLHFSLTMALETKKRKLPDMTGLKIYNVIQESRDHGGMDPEHTIVLAKDVNNVRRELFRRNYKTLLNRIYEIDQIDDDSDSVSDSDGKMKNSAEEKVRILKKIQWEKPSYEKFDKVIAKELEEKLTDREIKFIFNMNHVKWSISEELFYSDYSITISPHTEGTESTESIKKSKFDKRKGLYILHIYKYGGSWVTDSTTIVPKNDKNLIWRFSFELIKRKDNSHLLNLCYVYDALVVAGREKPVSPILSGKLQLAAWMRKYDIELCEVNGTGTEYYLGSVVYMSQNAIIDWHKSEFRPNWCRLKSENHLDLTKLPSDDVKVFDLNESIIKL